LGERSFEGMGRWLRSRVGMMGATIRGKRRRRRRRRRRGT